MKGIKDWISSQMASSNSLMSLRPLSGNIADDPVDEESNNSGT